MATTFRTLAVLAGLTLLGACDTVGGTGGPRGTSVTRSHLGADFARGEVAVEPRFEVQAAGGVYEPAFAEAVAAELRTIGFTPSATPATSEFVATVDIASGTQATLFARAPDNPGTIYELRLKNGGLFPYTCVCHPNTGRLFDVW